MKKREYPNMNLVVSDTGWKNIYSSRCYYRDGRTVVFADNATKEQMQEYAMALKKAEMYGQEQYFSIEGNTIKFSHACDSGD